MSNNNPARALGITLEQYEQLYELVRSSTWPVLAQVIDKFVEKQASEMLVYNLEEGDRGLVLRKARHDGARLLRKEILSLTGEQQKPRK